MSGRIHDELRRIFDLALSAPPGERTAFLERECKGNADLRARVEAMLAAAEGDRPTAAPTSDVFAPAGEERETLDNAGSEAASIREGPGSHIGPYKLLQLIGEGGFGSVFMAEQERPVRRVVALKIIKLGMDTRAVIARFEAERQALALMDHPGIARVLDAGATSAGRPFFVMELCKGDAIVEYCDKNNLSIPDRLELFAQVCQAVQHAHTKGIIHRDIKPSNVLVSTQDGSPHAKVIDFGIAKATGARLTEKTIFTEHRQLIGTPEYMSPEQAEGSLDIDTRTDVYSLGVLLYELLTGTTPFSSKELRSAAYAEILRIIREVEPHKPSTRLSSNTGTIASVAAHRHTEPRKLGTLIRGDLDWIVMKALEKDRLRRYETASGLALDIRRYLAGEAVLAAPPSSAYRLRKFVRRNRGRVVAAGVIAAALVLGMAGTTVGLVRAHQAQARQESLLDSAMGSLSMIQSELAAVLTRGSQSPPQPGLGAAIALSGPGAARAYGDAPGGTKDPFATPGDRALAVRQLGEASHSLLNWAASAYQEASDKRKEAEARAEELKLVSDFQEKMLEQVDPTMAGVRLTEDVNHRFAAVLARAKVPEEEQRAQSDAFRAQWMRVNATDAARALIDETILKPAAKAIDEQFNDQPRVAAQLRQVLANLYRKMGLYDAALPLQQSALDTRRRELGREHHDTLVSVQCTGVLLVALGRINDAEPYYTEALETRRRVLGPEHHDTLDSISGMGALRVIQDRLEDAERLYREALESRRRLFGDDNPATLVTLSQLGTLRRLRGDLPQAEQYLGEALERRRRVLGSEHGDTATSVTAMATVLSDQSKYAQSEALCREALADYRRVLGEDHPYTIAAIGNLGAVLRRQSKLSEAEPLIRDALERSRRVLGDEHPDTIKAVLSLSTLLQFQGRPDQAEPLVRGILEMRRRTLGPDHRETLESVNNLGVLLQARGKLAEAEAFFRESLDGQSRTQGKDQPETITSMHNLAVVLHLQHKYDECEPYLRDALERSRRVRGPEHEGTLGILSTFGLLYLDTGRIGEAEKYLRESLEGRRRVLGDKHLETLASFNIMGSLLEAQRKPAEAEAVYKQGLSACEAAFDVPHPQTALFLHHHANALRDVGRLEEALVDARKAVDMYRANPAWSPQESSHALFIVTTILTAQNKTDEAIVAQRELLAHQRATTRPGSAEYANGLAPLASSLVQRGTLESAREAEPLLREYVEIRARISPKDWRVPNARSLLGAATVTIADQDPALTPEARAERLREAEPLLVDGYTGLRDHPSVPPLPPPGDRLRDALQRIVHLYEVWDKIEPGKGYDAKASEWKARLADRPAPPEKK